MKSFSNQLPLIFLQSNSYQLKQGVLYRNKIKKMVKNQLFAILSFLLLVSCSSDGVLIKNGESSYKIFVLENAIASEKYAAKQLQNYLYEISGSRLEIINRTTTENKIIYVGFNDVPAKLLNGINHSEFGKEEYIIRSDGKSMLIAGGETRGTLYGVVGYLTDHLGCRWYTKDISKIPSKSVIRLIKTEDRQKPALEGYRGAMVYRESYDNHLCVFNRDNSKTMGDSLGGSYITYPSSHSFDLLIPPDEYFSTNPEFFSEVGGRRISDGQLCLTNPEMVKTATAKVLKWIEQKPEASVIMIGQNDGGGYCECESCSKINEREGSQSGTILTFINQIADSVAKIHPDVMLQTFAYDYSETPPKNIRPAENVMIELCHYDFCSAHQIDGCEVNRPFFELFNQWSKIAPGRITIWDYYTNYQNYLIPYPNFESFSRDVKFYADNGVKGLYAEGNWRGGGEFAELKSWVIAQLMWNPDQDAKLLISEFVNNVYGDAAPYIEAYIKLLHEQVTPDMRLSIWAEPSNDNMKYLNYNTIHTADSLFALAEKAAARDSVLADRIELAYLSVLWTKLYFYTQGGTAYISKEDLPEALERFKYLLKKYDIKEIAEDGNLELSSTIKTFYDKIEKASSSEFFTDWWLAGLFDNSDKTGLKKVFLPEESIFDSEQEFIGKNNEKVVWRKYNDNTIGYVNLNKVFGWSEYVVAYAATTLNMSEAETVKFGVGNNDGIRIWVNGNLVFNQAGAALGPNQNFFTAKLNKGENSILVKIDQLKLGWGFYLSKII